MKTLIVLIRNTVAGLESCSLKQKDDITQIFVQIFLFPASTHSLEHPGAASRPCWGQGGLCIPQLSLYSSAALVGQQCLLLETTRQQNPWNCHCSVVKTSLANPHTNTTHNMDMETNTPVYPTPWTGPAETLNQLYLNKWEAARRS